MMGLSLPHLIVLALVVLLLFGRGKISDLMGDFGKGIKSFKEGIADETTNRPVTPPAQLTTQPVQPSLGHAPATVAAPHPEVLPHGQAAASSAAPTLNGEPLAELAAEQQPR
jgi:sec-independent protein translocase protein TatA